MSNFRLELKWKDEFLSWNASQAKGIEDLRLEVEDIWVPDIEVFNLVSRKGLREGEQTGVIVFGIEPSSSCQPAFLSPLHSPLPLPRDLYQSKFKIQKWWWLAFVSRPDQTLESVRLKILKDP